MTKGAQKVERPGRDECPASGLDCSYGPHGPNKEMQCRMCGGEPVRPTCCCLDFWDSHHPDCPVTQWAESKAREIADLKSKLAEAEARIARMKEAGEDLVQAGNRLMENTRWDNATINWNRAIHGGPEVKL